MSKLSNLSDENAIKEEKSHSETTQNVLPRRDSRKNSNSNVELSDLSEEDELNSSSSGFSSEEKRRELFAKNKSIS